MVFLTGRSARAGTTLAAAVAMLTMFSDGWDQQYGGGSSLIDNISSDTLILYMLPLRIAEALGSGLPLQYTESLQQTLIHGLMASARLVSCFRDFVYAFSSVRVAIHTWPGLPHSPVSRTQQSSGMFNRGQLGSAQVLVQAQTHNFLPGRQKVHNIVVSLCTTISW
nr:hypothetical protein CFP56_68160 [Quercus suber]